MRVSHPVVHPLQSSQGAAPDIWLDGVRHPYASSLAALESESAIQLESPETLAESLRARLGNHFRVPASSIHFLDSLDGALIEIAMRAKGPIVGFPPSTSASLLDSIALSQPITWIVRGSGRKESIDVESAIDFPANSIAIIESPSDPLGSILASADIVRLARACRVVVVDERHAQGADSSVLPLTSEFDNIVVLRSLESWAGIVDPPCAWCIGSPRTLASLGVEEVSLTPAAAAAGIATLANLDSVYLALRMIRDERSRLYRLLRKFAFIEPIPSWGPFMAARVTLGPREALISGLAHRGVHIHAPLQPGLERIVRIGIASRTPMERLKWALIDLAPELVQLTLTERRSPPEPHHAEP